MSEYYEIPHYSAYDMAVDKDVLVPGNVEYGPYRCLILPGFINSKVQLNEFERDRIERLMSGSMLQLDIMKLF